MMRPEEDEKRRPCAPLYFALQDLDLTWYQCEVGLMLRFWELGWCLPQLAHWFVRTEDEVRYLLEDLTGSGMLKARPGAWRGQCSWFGACAECQRDFGMTSRYLPAGIRVYWNPERHREQAIGSHSGPRPNALGKHSGPRAPRRDPLYAKK